MDTDYFGKLDSYLAPHEENRFLTGKTYGEGGPAKLGVPITPISKLGTTFAEKGANGQGTVLQSMLSSIRQGTGLLQLAMQTDHNAVMMGGVSSIGKDQRQAIKEVIKASEIKWQGLEMPTSSMSNVSGFDQQRGGFSEQKRQNDLRAVKNAILFTADIGAGGGVDIWSQEFQRNIEDGSFKQKDSTSKQFVDFEGYKEGEHAIKTLIDDRTGAVVHQFQTGSFGGNGSDKLAVPVWETAVNNGVGPNGVPFEQGDYLDAEGNKLKPDPTDKDFIMNRVPKWNEKESRFVTKKLGWDDFKKYAAERNQKEGLNLSPEEWVFRVQLENQYAQQRGQSFYYTQRYNKQTEELKELVKAKQLAEAMEQGKSEKELIEMGLLMQVPTGGTTQASGMLPQKQIKKSEFLQESISDLKQSLIHTHESASMADNQAEIIWNNVEHVKRTEDYAKEKTFDSYAELGLFALEQTKQHNPTTPIHVGPELGWPQAYGGHPQEFIEIINKSRETMIQKMKHDPKYRGMYTDSQMKELAKKHIAGMMDTSHLSMWYNYFPKDPKNPHESEDSRLKRFNKWFLNQMEVLGKSDTVGSVQVVDSATGDHRHLPVGQGIFPMVDGLKLLQKNGFTGDIISEGHEEENIEPGRIQYSLWQEFGATTGSTGYHFGASGNANVFGNVYTGGGGAAGYRAPPNFMIPGYAPTNEWKTWSEVPLD